MREKDRVLPVALVPGHAGRFPDCAAGAVMLCVPAQKMMFPLWSHTVTRGIVAATTGALLHQLQPAGPGQPLRSHNSARSRKPSGLHLS